MFEKALIYRIGVTRTVDLGLLAETLFFYGCTHLLVDSSSILALAQKIPHRVLLELFDRNAIQLSYIRDRFAVASQGVPVTHNFVSMRLVGTPDGEKIRNYQEELLELLERKLGKSKTIRKLANDIANRITLHRFRGVPEKEKVVTNFMRTDIEDNEFVQRAVQVTLTHLVPGFEPSTQIRFHVFKTGQGDYIVDTNLDFRRLNDAYHTVVPPEHSSISVEYLLSHLLDARADTFFAAYYMAEPVTLPLSSDIMRLKHFEFLRRRASNAEDIELFHELIVPEFPTIREAINSGNRSIEELLKLLDQAAKFRKWLTEANPDVGLIQSYYKEAAKKSWIETLPGKGIRFIVAAGTGFGATAVAGPAAGLGVGATNTFLVDQLLKGWRPNRFIEGPYKKFVSGPDSLAP